MNTPFKLVVVAVALVAVFSVGTCVGWYRGQRAYHIRYTHQIQVALIDLYGALDAGDFEGARVRARTARSMAMFAGDEEFFEDVSKVMWARIAEQNAAADVAGSAAEQ